MNPTHKNKSLTALRVILVALGAVSAFVAINVAVGGLETLGWQGSTKYFTVTDNETFQIRDSHSRYYGGVYLGIAAFLTVAATNPRKYGATLNVVFGLIFTGGLARLTQLEPNVTFGPDLLVSSAIELAGIPLLALWLASLTRAGAASPHDPRTEQRKSSAATIYAAPHLR